MAIKPTYADNRLYAGLYAAKLQYNVIPIGSWHAFGEGRDIDYVVWNMSPTETIHDSIAALTDIGFDVTLSEYICDDDVFVCMRMDDINLMVTHDQDFAEKSALAFQLVRALDLREKADRIKVHQIIVDGKDV